MMTKYTCWELIVLVATCMSVSAAANPETVMRSFVTGACIAIGAYTLQLIGIAEVMDNIEGERGQK